MDNFIEIYKNALSDKTSDYIINCFEEFKDYIDKGQVSGGVNKNKLDSSVLNLAKIEQFLPEFLFYRRSKI